MGDNPMKDKITFNETAPQKKERLANKRAHTPTPINDLIRMNNAIRASGLTLDEKVYACRAVNLHQELLNLVRDLYGYSSIDPESEFGQRIEKVLARAEKI
jgi:hypothetical protein